MLFRRSLALLFVTGTVCSPALAHHSYAMFDGSRAATVSGTVAKLEWSNPHVFIWLYVPDPRAASGYALYAFENGSMGVLSRLGWSKDTFVAGESLTVEYWPLKDGRPGGHFHKATRATGEVIAGAGGPRVISNAARAGNSDAQR
jgi:hypothetical protein